MSTLDELQRTQATSIMSILQIEMNMEASRSHRLTLVSDPEEKEKMEELFEAQREACRMRIEGIKGEHRRLVGEKVEKIVRYKKVAVKERSMMERSMDGMGVLNVELPIGGEGGATGEAGGEADGEAGDEADADVGAEAGAEGEGCEERGGGGGGGGGEGEGKPADALVNGEAGGDEA